MSVISNIQLVFDPKDCYHHYQNPIWTFDYTIDDEIETKLEQADFGVEKIFVSRRDQYNVGNSAELDTLLKDFSYNFRSVLADLLTLKKEILSDRWLRKSGEDLMKVAGIHTKIFRDPPKFSMTPHLDNTFMIANAILNLVDNEDSTTFHDYRNPKKVVFVGPKKKNKGIIFLNTPGSLHSISNTSNRPRYIINSSAFLEGIV